MNIELVTQALFNLRKEGARTFLTLIGIVIGIAAIVSLLSIGTGLGVTFAEQFEGLGSNSVFASPGDAFSTGQSSSLKISQTDLKNIRQISNVKEVIAEYAGAGALHFDGETKNSIIFSIDEDGFAFFKDNDFVTLVEGRWIEPNESSSIMIDQTLATDTFSRDLSLRKQVDISGETFKVVGIIKMGAAFAAFGGGGGIIFTTINGHKRIDPNLEVSEIIIKTNTAEDAPQVKDDVTTYFEDKYGKKSITVLTSDQAIEQVGSILSLLTLVVAGIGGISLIVGGIGIMNAMITNVLERTSEIGLYKSLGASNNKILTIFILEAAFIGLIGGIIGILLGAGAANLIGLGAQLSGLPLKAVITPEIILGALAFSLIIGVASGFYPALKASKMDPVEAIRKD
ncbi:MAG: ABC transporter permease [archaeon]|jgi:putative ABC transport system permease protein